MFRMTTEVTETKATKKKVKSIAELGVTINAEAWVKANKMRYLPEAMTAKTSLQELQDIALKDFKQAENAFIAGKT